MPEYYLYFKGADGRIRHRLDMQCESDEEAIRTVADHQTGEAMELWERARKVREFPAETKAGRR